MGYIGKVTDTAGSTHLIGSTLYGTCDTAAGTSAKVVTCPNFTELVTGITIHVKFANGNMATNPTMKVENTAAKNIRCYGTASPGTSSEMSWFAGSVVSFTYDGTSWVMNDYIYDKDNSKVSQKATTADSDYPILFKYNANQTEETQYVRYGNAGGKVPKINPRTGNISASTFNEVQITENPTSTDAILIASSDAEVYIPKDVSYTLGDACEKGVDTSISAGSTSTKLPTTAAIVNYIASQAAGAATFQGTLVQTDSGNSGTKWTQAELEATSYTKGWYWVCEVAGTYAGEVLETGDMLFCVSDKSSSYSASDFTAIQNNIETLTTTEVSTLWTNAVAVA